MNYFQVCLNYQKQTGEDNPGKVKEVYLAEAMSPSDAETIVTKHVKPFIFGDFEVTKIQKRLYFEIINGLNLFDPYNDNYYEGKVELITIEDSGREVRKAITVLAKGTSLTDALKNLKDVMNGYDCEIVAIKKSPILEIIKPEITEPEQTK